MSWRSYPEVGTLLGMRLVAGALRLFGRRSAAALSLLRCPVYFVCALFEPPNRYEVHWVPLAERVELPRGERAAAVAREATRYAGVLEDYLRRSPLNWFNCFPFWVES